MPKIYIDRRTFKSIIDVSKFRKGVNAVTILKRFSILVSAVIFLLFIFSIAITPTIAAYLITSTSQIKDGVIKGADIYNGTLTASDLAANSVYGSKIATNTISAGDIATNGVGDAEMIDSPTFLSVATGAIYSGFINLGEDTWIIGDSGNGSPASDTLEAATSMMHIDCQDADGCDLSIDTTLPLSGDLLLLLNDSLNDVTVIEGGGIDLAGLGNLVLGHNDTLLAFFNGSIWFQVSASDN